MKPIIVYTEDKDTIKLSKEAFEQMIEQAYQDGYEEGKKVGRTEYVPTTTPYTPDWYGNWWGIYPPYTGKRWWEEITCKPEWVYRDNTTTTGNPPFDWSKYCTVSSKDNKNTETKITCE